MDTFVNRKSSSAIRQVLEDALQAHDTVNFEFEFDTKSGAVVVLLITTTYRHSTASNTGSSVICVGQDMTELKKAEESRMKFAEERAKFMSHMCHELRTPLNGVICATELLFGTTLSTDQVPPRRSSTGEGVTPDLYARIPQ